MAVWQFAFALAPREGVKRVHGSVPKHIPDHTVDFGNSPEEIDLDQEPNYWEPIDPRTFAAEIKTILPPTKSWSPDALMFGDDKVHDIDLWQDDVRVRFDLRAIELPLIQNVTSFARKHDLLVIVLESGKILEPEVNMLVDHIKGSQAARFVTRPKRIFRINR